MAEVTLEVNGKKVTKAVPDNTLLSTFLREHLNLTKLNIIIKYAQLKNRKINHYLLI